MISLKEFSNAGFKKSNKYFEKNEKPETILHPMDFDPNTASFDQLTTMGLPGKLINRIINYREKGGKFFNENDFKKIYGIDPEMFLILQPFIKIKPREIKSKNKVNEPGINSRPDLNSIGFRGLNKHFDLDSVFVKNFLWLRKNLGGFFSKEQIMEIPGYSSQLHLDLIENSIIDSTMIYKININEITSGELKKHPYFSGGIANALVSFRIAHGNFKNVSDVRKCDLVNDELYRKIAPYLKIN